MERERQRLLEESAEANAEQVAALERDMNERVRELASAQSRAFLEPRPEGVPLAALDLDADEQFTAMERERQRLLEESAEANAEQVAALERDMNERVRELASAQSRAFLEPRPEGVPLAALDLEADEQFTAMERERQRLLEESAEGNAEQVAALERDMNEHVRELASAQSRAFLEPRPEGVPLAALDLDADEQFTAMERERQRLLEESAEANAEQVAALERDMNERVRELARAQSRAFLEPRPEGVPLAALDLDADEQFTAMERERQRLLEESAEGNAEQVAALERDMNERVRELASAQSRAFLEPRPEGVPLAALDLDADEQFTAMERERQRLLEESAEANAEQVAALERDMSERVRELASAQSRAFLEPRPEGVPLAALDLDADEQFTAMERERQRLLEESAEGNAEQVAALERDMNERVRELARAQSRAFLEPRPEGVPLAALDLDADEQFTAMERERQRLLEESAEANAEQVAALERDMNERVRELARAQSRALLEPRPEGVPLAALDLDADEQFTAMERERQRLLEESAEVNIEQPVSFPSCVDDGFLSPDEYSSKQSIVDNDVFRYDSSVSGGEVITRNVSPSINKVAYDSVDVEVKQLETLFSGSSVASVSVSADASVSASAAACDVVDSSVRRSASPGVGFVSESSVDEWFFVMMNNMFGPCPSDVPVDLLMLKNDSTLVSFARELRSLRDASSLPNSGAVEQVTKNITDRVEHLILQYKAVEREFLKSAVGVSLSDVPLDDDPIFCELEKQLRKFMCNPDANAEVIEDQKYAMTLRAVELADGVLCQDRSFLNNAPLGLPLSELTLDDPLFHEMELKRRRLKELDPVRYASKIKELEQKLNDHVNDLAFHALSEQRSFLDPNPCGIPLSELPLDVDDTMRSLECEYRKILRESPRNLKLLRDIRAKISEHVRKLALDVLNCQDVEFHKANQHAAEKWPRIGELYPEGAREPVVPEVTSPSDVSSAPRELGYLAPFIAALSRHPQLIHRLIDSKAHPVNAPYSFIFFDPHSNPVRVDIDDRVPVNANFEPKFTRVPRRSWYPLLLEKAYAKFVGGYDKLDHCTPHETLRDLTGRPVTHIPFEEKRADGIKMGDFRSTKFWREVRANLDQGDVMTCISNPDCVDGIHPQCSYAVLGVVETVSESNDPSDVVIKLHNCYPDEPVYSGPLRRNDRRWTEELKRVCRYHPDEDVLYLPLPVFLRNFSSMQRCHVNCGDRLTSVGEWNEVTGGGNPRYTSFRNNPIYLVENKSSRPVTILAELRHHAPVFFDADGAKHFHQSGLALLQQHQHVGPLSWLLTNSTHRFLQKGIMLDTREVCSQMELPPKSMCYLVPYAMKRGGCGEFSLSVYPGAANVSLTPLRPLLTKHMVLNADVILKPGSRDSKCVDFVIGNACDVHVLLCQSKVTEPLSVKRGNVIAEDSVTMSLFDENKTRLASTGDPTSAREHSISVNLPVAGRYRITMCCPNRGSTGDCPCVVSLYVPRTSGAKIVSIPSNGMQALLPALQRSPMREGSWTLPTERGNKATSSRSAPKIEPRATQGAAFQLPRIGLRSQRK
ncbi:putative Calpain family cysteine protease [Trypanosoma vivax]|nr:putative Calpain family cysteine protease [Trypanosoma vivax]